MRAVGTNYSAVTHQRLLLTQAHDEGLPVVALQQLATEERGAAAAVAAAERHDCYCSCAVLLLVWHRAGVGRMLFGKGLQLADTCCP